LFIEIETVYVYRSKIRKVLNARNAFEMLHILFQETGGVLPMLRFSPRGKKVFTLMLQGLGQREIGELMSMSVNGVKRHREKMLLQNDCNSMTELLLKYHGQPCRKDLKACSLSRLTARLL
jgi:DNA-binding CsgD family transcriptional regulator